MEYIPPTLKIGGHTINIVLTDDIDKGDEGEFDADTLTIKIRSSLPPSWRGVILLHEIMHACNSTFGYEEDTRFNGFDHMFLDSLAQQLYQVMHDNQLRF